MVDVDSQRWIGFRLDLIAPLLEKCNGTTNQGRLAVVVDRRAGYKQCNAMIKLLTRDGSTFG